MAAQTAVSFIRKGCDMLHEGRMELEGAKKTVERVIDDVKAISGMWDWFLGLFKSKKEQPKPIVQKKASAVAKKKQESYEELELKLINDIGANISVLFDTQQKIRNYYYELEEESKTNFKPEQNTSKKAIERALIELQMEKLVEQTREAMVYAPMELKDLYSRFLAMRANIEREQEWARKEMLNRARIARRKKEQEEIQRIEFITGVGAVFFISLIFWWFMWELHVLSSG